MYRWYTFATPPTWERGRARASSQFKCPLTLLTGSISALCSQAEMGEQKMDFFLYTEVLCVFIELLLKVFDRLRLYEELFKTNFDLKEMRKIPSMTQVKLLTWNYCFPINHRKTILVKILDSPCFCSSSWISVLGSSSISVSPSLSVSSAVIGWGCGCSWRWLTDRIWIFFPISGASEFKNAAGPSIPTAAEDTQSAVTLASNAMTWLYLSVAKFK